MTTVPRYLTSGLKRVKQPKNDAHLYDTIIHLNPSQMSLAREYVAQLAGRGASALYGHQKFAEPFTNPALRRAAHQMVDLPQHHFARVAVRHKEIGGALKDSWKDKLRTLGTHFINNIGTYADIGTGIGQMTGLISGDTGDAIRSGADVVGSMFGKGEDEDENKEEGAGVGVY
jgi:hypothetical protein